jgi:hypothetical protein
MSQIIRYKYKVLKDMSQLLPDGTFKEYKDGDILYNLYYNLGPGKQGPMPGETIWACEDESKFWIPVQYLGVERGEIRVRDKNQPKQSMLKAGLWKSVPSNLIKNVGKIYIIGTRKNPKNDIYFKLKEEEEKNEI